MWSDRETLDDCLGFSSYVASLSEVCLEKDIAPLTLGVFGSWGSGKTSLMKMLQKAIEDRAAGRRIKTLWFNAWRYEGKDEIQTALIHAVLTKLTEDKSFLEDAKEVLQRLKKGASVLKLAKFIGRTAITITPNIGEFLDCFQEESEKVAETMERFEKDFEELLTKMKVERVVVFIDDLDRCQSEKVIETFETIKLFLNVPECTFVIGADAAKIQEAVSSAYRVGQQTGEAFSADYLEKIIQLPFRIPEQRPQDISCYIGMLVLRGHLGEEGWRALLRDRTELVARGGDGFAEWVTKNNAMFPSGTPAALTELQRVHPYVTLLAQGLKGNPRQIKRFLNILELRRRLAEANRLEVKSNLLIKLLVLEYTWRPFFKNVVETFNPATGTSDLIAEVIGATKRTAAGDEESAMLTTALETPGLPQFLAAEPSIEGVDLAPYLFLSQTALTAERGMALTLPEEKAKSLANRIASEDRIRSRSATQQVVREDKTVIAAVVRQLIPTLVTATDPRCQVNIMTGLTTICEVQPEHYAAVVQALKQVDPKKNEALALIAVTFLGKAMAAKVDGAETLKEAFGQASTMAAALSGTKGKVRAQRGN
jgi:hypothetical protein